MKNKVQTVAKVLEKKRKELFKKAHVVGVGIGEKVTGGLPTGRMSLKVYVEKKLAKHKLSKHNLIPKSVAGVETDVEEVGKIKSLAYTGRMRPALGGVSIGHVKITAGTLGCLVRDKKTRGKLILSNNHVLANSNAAKKGDKIIQPGAVDGGKLPKDLIGRLDRWVNIDFSEVGNWVDCAAASPTSAASVKPEIISIGAPKGVTKARIGTVVQKTGRTTEFTMGKVKDVSMTVKVNYGRKTALFHNQILTTAMSQGGDSGSLVLDQAKRAVGLLFAGSDTVTLCNPIQEVFKRLGVGLA